MTRTIPDQKIHLSVCGPASGPEILLVHGIGVSGQYFVPLARALSTTHRVLTPDLPGFGKSGRPRPALSIEEQASALDIAFELKDRREVVLVGHSMGSQVVTELAARRPGMARGLVLIGPVAERPAGSALLQAWRLGRDLPREPLGVNVTVLRDYVRGGVRSFTGTLPHMLSYPLAERLATVTAPLVLVRGEHDPIASSAFLERLHDASPGGGQVVEIPGAGHVAMAVRQDVIAGLCRRL